MEVEIVQQKKELAALKERQEQLINQMQALGYAESDYLEARKRQVTLKPLHDRFLAVSERAAQIPALTERMKKARARDREARPGPEGSANLAKGSGIQSARV